MSDRSLGVLVPGSPPKPKEVRDALARSIAGEVKSYNVAELCDRVGIPARDGEGDPFSSKAVFVSYRLTAMSTQQVLRAAQNVLREWDDPALEDLVGQSVGGTGVGGELLNIVFAANGPKPHIVLTDALNNKIDIVKNRQYCLLYDRPLSYEGVSWAALVDWWVSKTAPEGKKPDLVAASRALWLRLNTSLASEPEKMLFRVYTSRYGKPGGDALPALLPQVYLHYDPFAHIAGQVGALFRQRMDFLLLLPNGVRIVLEIDGQHHYSQAGRPNPAGYADMVREDRALRLAGYEMYRFGGSEFVEAANPERMLEEYFDTLLAKHHAGQ